MSTQPKLWCAACGKWGNHTSGSCPTITQPEPEPSELESLRKRVAELQEKRVALAAQVKDLKAREDRQTGSWNTLANCADTLRARDFGTEYGAIDERVIAMAKALDAARVERDEWKAKAEKLDQELEYEHGRHHATRARAERLQAALHHMQWCRSCADGSWSDCEGGREALAALEGDTAKPEANP
jgi:DNA repair ATPase RecN